MFNYYEEFLDNYIPEWYEVFDEYSDLDTKGNIFVYRKDKDGNNWFNEKGEYHRIDGPAHINKYLVYYFINNMLHNINGPAIITNLSIYFYLNDIEYSKEEWEIERLKYA